MVNALGIAFSQAAGNRQCIVDGALTKRLQAGQAASSGVLAATLAREGFTGAHNIFLGRFGSSKFISRTDTTRPTDGGLGAWFAGEQLSFKPYPCGRPQHAILDAAIAVRRRMDSADAASVTICVDAATLADQFSGAPHKRRPTQIVEAQFALPFLIATALIHGRVGIGEVGAIDDKAVLDLAARIEGKAGSIASVTAQGRDGRMVTVEAGTPLGSPDNPLTIGQLRAKFADCARNAVRPLTDETIAQAADCIMNLAEVGTSARW